MELLAEFMEEPGSQSLALAFFEMEALGQLLFRFIFNFIVVGIIIHCFYYPKSKRRDYYFTFSLINVSVFLLILLMGSVKLKIGFALGIFAIFGIIRYRTEQVPIREMTYLFVIIAISVINALAVQISYAEMLVTNALFIGCIWLLESERWLKHTSCKLILYDKIQLITPDRQAELLDDLKKRTGLPINKVEVGHIDFLRDAAFIKVYYESDNQEINTVDHLTRFPRED
ncbi:putative membrane protein [Parabacteroides sp. PF5-6]|nr:putative membrane protein [Parabacteroides sp. PF5-6]